MTFRSSQTCAAHFDRAHLQGRVIASNLDHLSVVLGDADAGLQGELTSIRERFGRYVARLDKARSTGDARGGAGADLVAAGPRG